MELITYRKEMSDIQESKGMFVQNLTHIEDKPLDVLGNMSLDLKTLTGKY